jgi:O-antigen/teichoic acid export membrane protein
VTETARIAPNQAQTTLRAQVRSAVIWRSSTQIAGQTIAWLSTFLVIRILAPQDYGLFAMTQVVLTALNMLNGYGLASALIQRADAAPGDFDRATRQLFGMLIMLNFGLAAAQFLTAPLAAAYFRNPEVADLLRVQSLLSLTTPFIALPYALLSRAMDFRRQAAVNLVSAVAGAIAALACAYGGLGVWTLVVAPLALFGTRAIGMMIAANAWMRPSFDFRGAGTMARYGGTMAAGQLFWFLQSQADVFIAGRLIPAYELGIYTTSLFLTQIFVSKFVPPLNEVAFSAYARIHNSDGVGDGGVGDGFLVAVRTILLVAMPFYLGLAVVAEPLVHVVLGEKWLAAGPIVATLALAMPFMTLQVLFAPASDACGKPGISLRTGIAGAIILPGAFLIGVQWGIAGMAIAWVAAYPLYLVVSARMTLPAIGVRARDLIAAMQTPLLAGLAMAAILLLVRRALPPLSSTAMLALLVPLGGLLYFGWLLAFARDALRDAVQLIRSR